MPLKPITRTENFLGRASGNPDAVKLTPITREEHFLEDVVKAIENQPQPVEQEAVLYVEQTLTAEQKQQARLNIGAADESGIPEGFRQNLIAALSAGAFATSNGAELVAALESEQ